MKTALKKKCNKVFNNYLKEVDTSLYKHMQKQDLQPELMLLKYLRCIFARDFEI
jgi:TBC1 domain family protein 5